MLVRKVFKRFVIGGGWIRNKYSWKVVRMGGLRRGIGLRVIVRE